MTPTRREFLRGVALALASLALTRCSLPEGLGREKTPRDRLRTYWLQLDILAAKTQDDFERGEEMREQLTDDHRIALDELVAAGGLTAAVADDIQAAFREAAYHVWRAAAPITCYEPVLIDYTPTSADQLVEQADLLAEMAESSALDAQTVARVQAVIERDVAFLALAHEDVRALYDRLVEAAGDSYAFPSFDELELEIPPEAVAAAHFLVELLLEEG